MSGSLHRRIERALSAVSSLGATVASRTSGSELLDAVVKAAKEILEGDLAAIALYDVRRESLEIRAAAGPAPGVGTTIAADGALALVAAHGMPRVYTNDAETGAARAVVCPLGTLGVLVVGQTAVPAAADDAADLTILSLFAEQAAAVLRTGQAIQEERSFSSKLLRLGGYVARAGAGWAPEGLEELLREIAMAVGGDAIAIVETSDDSFRIRDSWNLPAELPGSWALPVSRAPAVSFSSVVPAIECGFATFARDLVVRVPRSGIETRLHVLSRDARAFSASDVRLSEVIAVHVGSLLDRLSMMREMQVATQAERHASMRLRDLYDDIGEGIVVLDGSGKVSFASRRTFHILHASPNQLLGRVLFDELSFEDRLPLVHAFLKAAAGSRARAEVRVTTPAGTRVIELSARPDDRTDPTRAVRMVLRDVTDERRRESDTLHREKLASVGELAAGVAHEINNPVSFVLSNARWLAGRVRDLEEAFRAYREVAGEDASSAIEERFAIAETMLELPQVVADSLEGLERVRRIVGDMRMISRKDPEEATDVDLAALVDSTLAMCAPMLRMRATIEREIAALPILRAWPGRLSQALLNLLVNAAQAIPEGAPQRHRVVVRAWSDAEWVHLSVTDTGAGIAPQHKARLFTPFFTTKPPGEGTGLGLALAYEAVRRHGGRIVVESELGKGATFTIVIPASGVAAPTPAPPAGDDGEPLRIAV